MARKKSLDDTNRPARKPSTSFNLSPETHAALDRLHSDYSISRAGAVEVGVRLLARTLEGATKTKAEAKREIESAKGSRKGL